MAIAVAVLLFIMAAVFLVLLLLAEDAASFVACLAILGIDVAAGVLNIVADNTGLQIATGVWLCLWAVAAVVLTVMAFAEEPVLGILAFLGAAWVITFAVLQLTIVV